MKILSRSIIFLLVVLFTSCTDNNNPAPANTSSMSFKVNGGLHAFSFAGSQQVDAQPGDKNYNYVIVGELNNGLTEERVEITLSSTTPLHAAMVFTSDPGALNYATMNYIYNGIIYTSQGNAPLVNVNITEVSAIAIKGTFSANIFDPASLSVLKYNLTDGNFSFPVSF